MIWGFSVSVCVPLLATAQIKTFHTLTLKVVANSQPLCSDVGGIKKRMFGLVSLFSSMRKAHNRTMPRFRFCSFLFFFVVYLILLAYCLSIFLFNYNVPAIITNIIANLDFQEKEFYRTNFQNCIKLYEFE